jgi:hypothetical protein
MYMADTQHRKVVGSAALVVVVPCIMHRIPIRIYSSISTSTTIYYTRQLHINSS